MSEYLNNIKERREKLLELALGLLKGKRQAAFVRQFEAVLEAVTPRDVVFVVDGMVRSGADMEVLKKAVSQVINLMYLPLQPSERRRWDEIPFLHDMVSENIEMEQRMNAVKQLVKTVNVKGIKQDQLDHLKGEIRSRLQALAPFDRHYIRKENILFPYLEKAWPDFRCLGVMWSLHDDVRVALKLLDELLEDEHMDMEEFNYAIGTLYFSVFPLIYREENILFPVAAADLPAPAWDEMQEQAGEIGHAFISPSGMAVHAGTEAPHRDDQTRPAPHGALDLGTGQLAIDQLIGVFDHLPVDITFVDDRDEVRYFNNPRNRHFPRSKAIIGRKVQNCHPPESIDVVNRIVESFRDGSSDSESFWIQMKGRFIHIRYFAVRESAGKYLGTLEVSQDVTEIRSLKGEKRLLDEEG